MKFMKASFPGGRDGCKEGSIGVGSGVRGGRGAIGGGA